MLPTHRATEADNAAVVKKLVEEFHANVFTNHPVTAENPIHISCRNLSKLRYYFTELCPDLLKNPDIHGTFPLFIACSLNDIEFVSWLFRGILDEETDDNELGEMISAHLPRSTSLPNIAQGSSTTDQAIASNGLMSNHGRIRGRNPFMSLQAAALNLRWLRGAKGGDDFVDGLAEEDEVEADGVRSSVSSGSRDSEELELSTESSGSMVVNSVGESDLQSTEIHTSGDSHALQYHCPLDTASILDLKLFRITIEGESILHILANKGHADLLKLILKVGRFLERDVDLSILTRRDEFSERTPVETAIISGHSDCLRLFIVFALSVQKLRELLADHLLLKMAVRSKDTKSLRTLIEFGFHEGLAAAISNASVDESPEILRILLFFYTQCSNVLEFSHIHRNQTVSLDTGALKWHNLHLREVSPAWLSDSFKAVDSVSQTLSLANVVGSPTNNQQLFRQLGSECLRCIDTVSSPSSSSLPAAIFHSFTPITLLDLSQNHLTNIPPEIFQIGSLRTLDLSCNSLSELPPGSTPGGRPVYTCKKVRKLNLDCNQLTSLPEELFTAVSSSLEELSAQRNLLLDLPAGLWLLPRLQRVNLAQNKLSRLHHFSDRDYFVGSSLSKAMVSFHASDDGSASPKCCPSCSDQSVSAVEKKQVDEYLHEMGKFYHTLRAVCAANPDVAALAFVSEDIVQDLVDVHQVRCGCHICNPLASDRPSRAFSYLQSTSVAADEEDTDASAPPFIAAQLAFLDLSGNSFKNVPWDLPCIAPNLKKLDLRKNRISSVDIVHSFPPSLQTLHLDGNAIKTLEKGIRPSLPCGALLLLIAVQPSLSSPQPYCQHCRHQCLNNLSNLALNNNLLSDFPVLEVVSQCLPEYPDIPVGTFEAVAHRVLFPNLAILSLERNRFKTVPNGLHRLTSLCSLSLSHNDITMLPHTLGLLNPRTFFLLKLEGLSIKNVPPALISKPTPKFVLSYLKGILQK